MQKSTTSGVPDTTLAIYLGFAAIEAGDYSAAVQYFLMADCTHPQWWNCKFALGEAYSRTARPAQAMQEFQYISKWCPDNDLKAKASHALKVVMIA
jgi:Flp pilus assembly protein TadD